MTQTADVLLQSEQSGGTFKCTEFTGVPAARKSWICIASAGTPQARKLAEQLSIELEEILWNSSIVERKINPCGLEPSQLQAQAEPELRKLLVLVAADGSPLDDIAWYGNWNDDNAHSNLMVVLPAGVKYESLFTLAVQASPEHPLRKVNASFWNSRIAETVPSILSRAEITTDASRVFISYRRLETLPLALQLFDALTHEGFEAFLDRFSIAPGYDFQRRLNQELADKSMVVLLESLFIRKSEWTKHEINFTVRNRLGLLLVRMPDIDPKNPVATADATQLDYSDFRDPHGKDVIDEANGSYKQWGELTSDGLARVIAETKRVHAEALFRRRHRLRTDLVAALASQGIHIPYSAVGPIRISGTGGTYVVCTTTRPPEVTDFHDLHNSCATSLKGALVGPLATFEPDRERRLRWLEQVTGCTSFDEGNLAKVASWIIAAESAS